MNFLPVSKDLFFSKNDPLDPRLGEWARSQKKSDSTFCILGYPDDEGIRLNGGRPGAAEGPDSIRKYFYRMTPDSSVQKDFSLDDRGNLSVVGSLEDRHRFGRSYISNLVKEKAYWISLGGGHDYAYCDTSGFAEFFKAQKPLIVNFDAHLDVRSTEKGFNSGTPFYRLLTEFSKCINFIEIGAQPQCNSPHHLQWLKDQGGQVLWEDQIGDLGMPLALQQLVPLAIHPCFISVDIDGLSAAVAPGCSQSWASGLDWPTFAKAFDFLIESFDVRGLGIYEVSPPLDSDDRTSKLAALIMHRFIFNTLKKDPL